MCARRETETEGYGVVRLYVINETARRAPVRLGYE